MQLTGLSDTVSFEITSIEVGVEPSVYAVALRSTVVSMVIIEVKTPTSMSLKIDSPDVRLVILKTGALSRRYNNLMRNLDTNGA